MARVAKATLASLVAALVLPIVLFIALQAAFSMRAVRHQIEADALAGAREINAAVDGRLMADQGALQVLSTSQVLTTHDWTAAEARVAAIQAIRPGWRNAILTDAIANRAIWETRSGAVRNLPVRPWVATYIRAGTQRMTITGIVGAPPDCPCVAIHTPVFERGILRYVLTVELDPGAIQRILMAHSPRGSTSAIVDGRGLFIARTIAFPRKLGTPATRYVRAAIAHGKSGFYPGITYEGQRNFTAFSTSALSGWSAHIAVKAGLLAGPRLGAIMLTAVGAFAALALALGIAGYAYRQSRIRRREEALNAQSAKLAAVGQLASGIAHDFNNLLMIISNSLQRISSKSEDITLKNTIDNAIVASDRGASLIRQLMAFTRSQPLDIGPVDLQKLFDGLQGILQQLVGVAVQLQVDIADDARWVTSNASQLEMALVNLAVNARDAMPRGGSLTFRSAASKSKPGCIDLDVIDTGEGMPKAVVDRAMEPFFTTKPLGQGTGLGLAQVFGVVTQSNGSVEIHSRPGAGTTISLRLRRDHPPRSGPAVGDDAAG